MQLDEATRHEVFSTLRENLGETTAVVLMSAIPPFDWSEVALKADLVSMEERINGRFATLEERMVLRMESVEHRLTAAFERGIRRALVAQTFTVFGGVVALYVLAERFAG
jgi:hypothetical protein